MVSEVVRWEDEQKSEPRHNNYGRTKGIGESGELTNCPIPVDTGRSSCPAGSGWDGQYGGSLGYWVVANHGSAVAPAVYR